MRERMTRFAKFMEYKNLNDNQVTAQCALSQGLLGQARTGKSDLGKNTIDKILNTYQDLSKVWLLTGEGEMLNSSPPQAAEAIAALKTEGAHNHDLHFMMSECSAMLAECKSALLQMTNLMNTASQIMTGAVTLNATMATSHEEMKTMHKDMHSLMADHMKQSQELSESSTIKVMETCRTVNVDDIRHAVLKLLMFHNINET